MHRYSVRSICSVAEIFLDKSSWSWNEQVCQGVMCKGTGLPGVKCKGKVLPGVKCKGTGLTVGEV